MGAKDYEKHNAHLHNPESVAELLVNELSALGVEYVFGVPGGAIEPLYNALAKSGRSNGPRAVVSRHECGAALMAEGQFRRTGTIGVCCATTGPGSTNLITGVASAYTNYIPMLVLTAQTRVEEFGRGGFQESSCSGVDMVAIFKHFTRYSSLVSHPDQLQYKLTRAILHAFGPTPGPVHLSLPLDIMRQPIPAGTGASYIESLTRSSNAIDFDQLHLFSDTLLQAKKVVFVIGEGAAKGINEILSIVEEVGNIKLVTTPMGKGLIHPYHPDFHGVFGFGGHESSVETLQDPEVECVVAIGTSLDEWSSNAWDQKSLLNERLIHVDCVKTNFSYSPMATHIDCNIENFFGHLLEHLRQHRSSQFNVKSQDSTPVQKGRKLIPLQPVFSLDAIETEPSTKIHPAILMRELPKIFPNDTMYVAEPGNSFAWAIHYLNPRNLDSKSEDPNYLHLTMNWASMGWAIGTSIGMAMSSRDNLVVCITGDGSLLMAGQELSVAVQEFIPVIFVVLNDSSLGMVRHGQKLSGAESIGSELPKTSFAGIAESLGATGIEVHSVEDLMQLNYEKDLSCRGPVLLDIAVDDSAVPPMGLRARTLRRQQEQ